MVCLKFSCVCENWSSRGVWFSVLFVSYCELVCTGIIIHTINAVNERNDHNQFRAAKLLEHAPHAHG